MLSGLELAATPRVIMDISALVCAITQRNDRLRQYPRQQIPSVGVMT
jgi:hypothetical protein